MDNRAEETNWVSACIISKVRGLLLDSDCSSLFSKQDCKNILYLCFDDIPKCNFSQWRKTPKVAFCDTPEAVLLEIGIASWSSCSHQEDGKENSLISMGDDLRSFAHVCEILALFSLAFWSAKRYKCIILGSNVKVTFLERAFGHWVLWKSFLRFPCMRDCILVTNITTELISLSPIPTGWDWL